MAIVSGAAALTTASSLTANASLYGTTTTVHSAYHGTLKATHVDTITFSLPHQIVRIFNRTATYPIYIRVDGQDAFVGADENYVVAPNSYWDVPLPPQVAPVVSVLSISTNDYSIVAL